MSSFRNLYFLFLLSVLIPGLILSYLSFRTIEAEEILLEKAIENRNEEFVQVVENLIDRRLDTHLKSLQEQLRRSSFTPTAENYFFLATELLRNPLVQSLVILRNGEKVIPRPLEADRYLELPSSSWMQTLDKAQSLWRAARYRECIEVLQALLSSTGAINQIGPLGSRYNYGLRLLHIKCLIKLRMEEAAVESGRRLINLILESNDFGSYSQSQFYLEECVHLITSLENLPNETRDYFWSLLQRADAFFSNAEFVEEQWPYSESELNRISTQDQQRGILIRYYEATPFLVVGYPWMDRESRILARLNESLFSHVILEELVESKQSAWRDVDFILTDNQDQITVATDSIGQRLPALEKELSPEFPAYKLIILKKEENEITALSRRKVILLYVLLAFCLAALLVGTISVLISLRKERRVVQMKGNFLSAISHELKTPLTSISMFSEILESGKQPQRERQQEYARLIQSESRRLHAMIEDILNFTRLEDSKLRLKLEPLDLNDVIREVVKLMENAFHKGRVDLIQNLAPSAPLRGDRGSLHSVVQNLLDNALKYSGPDSTVRISTTLSNEKVELSVRDEGQGIEAQDLKHIFDKFYRAGDEMTRRTKGSGLGLAIVKQLVDLHKGQIKVHSKPGEGSEFIVTLPLERIAHVQDSRSRG